MEDIIKKAISHPKGKVKLAVTDLDGVLRGKFVHKNKLTSAIESGLGFCNVIFGWDSSDLLYDNAEHTGWHSGFPDDLAQIDLSTYREIPWEDNLPFFLADFENGVCPRTLLKKVIQRAEKNGFKAIFAQEFEWFNFQELSYPLHDKNHTAPKPITAGMFGYSLLRASKHSEFFNELFDLLNQFSVPLEGLHTETGPGVYEAAILYADVLEAADRAAIFKQAVKEIAMRHGITPSFMAKWNEHLPGCGGHIHQSLWQDEKNVFYDANDSNKMSELMKSFIAGQLYCLPHILPMYAPNINSYKRLVEGAWAPTTLTWGIDNRTVAIRAIPGGEKSTRVEFRVAGSDVNPYLAMAACLASGLYGVENNLKLERPMTIGNGYRDISHGVLPTTLHEATSIMTKSEIAENLFGKYFVSHFTKTREWEWRQSLKPVTDWELKRYFEII